MTVSFASILRGQAATQPAAPALTTAEGTLSYAELDTLSNRVANALLAAGVAEQGRVAHLGRNSRGYVALLYGASKVRASAVGLNWRLTATELRHLLLDADPALVLVDRELRAVLEEALATTGRSPVIVATEDLEAWAGGQPATDTGLSPEPDDTALVFYTSGTTGIPKGAMIPVASIDGNLSRPVPWTMRPEHAVLVVSPVFHTAGTGWVYLSAFFGAHCVLLRDPDPATILAMVERHRVAQALLVPALVHAVLNHPDLAMTDVSSLETVVYGASPIAPAVLVRAIEAFGCDMVQAYGMTETGGPITYLLPAEHDPTDPKGRLRSAGTPVGGVEVQVVDQATGAPLPPGAVGEVWTRSNQNMSGYLNRPDATAATITADGWLRTGDAGFFDADGFLYLTDRLSDVVVSGGENVYPVEVEHVLASHPAVADAAVIGVPDERWGETVKGIVVPVPGADPSAEELIAWCRDRLAHYKCPTSIDVATDLPRNPAGKVLRRILREPYWQGHGRTVG